MQNILTLFVLFNAIWLSGCQKTYVQIKTEYSNSAIANETRKVESDVKLYGTVKECAAWMKELLKFVNDEVMYQRRK